jgi:hypothetical protein
LFTRRGVIFESEFLQTESDCRAADELRKIALEEYGVEKEWFRKFEYIDGPSSISAEDVLTAVSWVGLKSLSSIASEETDDFLWNSAGLLDWVE